MFWSLLSVSASAALTSKHGAVASETAAASNLLTTNHVVIRLITSVADKDAAAAMVAARMEIMAINNPIPAINNLSVMLTSQ